MSDAWPRPIMMIRKLLKERRLEPRRDPMLDFAVKDTWRIFRIMGEFVEGFETLSQVKGVAIFGSARSLPGSADYQRAEEMGRALARAGYAVITGGAEGGLGVADLADLDQAGGLEEGQDHQPRARPSPSCHHTSALHSSR